MTDPLLDDVKALLDKDFGDDRILKQICRACENNEVISNYERNYVRQLAEKHLGKKPEFTPTPSVAEKPSVPDVIMPEIQSSQQTQSFQTQVPRISYSKSKNKKIMFGIGGLALVIIIAAAVSLNGLPTGTTINTSSDNTSISQPIQTDLKSYSKKDLISISGVSTSKGTVNLSIKNQNNEIVWAEQVSLKSDGRFSTLAIAGGSGWEKSGTYTITVDDGKEIKSNTFSFTA
ncbi:hypothetical protein C5F49_07865 [Nitrosopumilus oxyclinae]|uniref:Uncharacterized protein n=1 Tax=Nitrosopumilus oxyclinae TaxID=1959104 RepID=A0A7D5RBZ4_9ARCH|nr:hypothetical protein [Nitrosopumilus oxyclinae]QLH05243.1 hypothetical protein C5F49_07865 [Nitrosopumilus oxyclinae]